MKNGRIKHINELNLRLRDEIDALNNLILYIRKGRKICCY